MHLSSCNTYKKNEKWNSDAYRRSESIRSTLSQPWMQACYDGRRDCSSCCFASGRSVRIVNVIKFVISANFITLLIAHRFQRFSKVHEENLKRIEELRQVQARKKEIICVCCGEVNVITKKGHRGKLPCKKCRRPFCSSCGHNHSVGLSCTAWIEALGQGVAEAMQLMRHLGLARCPKCNMFAEKVAGCNFMTCRCSANFCFLCSAALDQTKHYSHFKGAPFGDSCLGPRDAVRLLNKK